MFMRNYEKYKLKGKKQMYGQQKNFHTRKNESKVN